LRKNVESKEKNNPIKKVVHENKNDDLLSEKVKNYMNVILLTNNNVNIKGNSNVFISGESKLTRKKLSKQYKRNNTEKGNTDYKRDFEDISEDQEQNEIQFPFIIQSLMK
jgi:hypothetical protein